MELTGLDGLLRDFYGVEHPRSYAFGDMMPVRRAFLCIPDAVELFWRLAGGTEELNHGQDQWMFPSYYKKWPWLGESKDLILFLENQGVCQALIPEEKLRLPNPPVYTRMAPDGPLRYAAPAFTDFMIAVLLYESVWQFDHSAEEFYWLTEEEVRTVQSKLEKYPAVLRNWMEIEEITFYQNRPDNLVVIMDMGGEYQCLYGARTEESYAALLEVMAGLGEPV